MLSRPEHGAPSSAARGPLAEHRLTFGEDEVPYLYGTDCVPELADAVLGQLGDVDALLFVVDAQVSGHATAVVRRLARQVRVEVHTVAAHESHKTLGTVQAIMDDAVARGLTRRSAVVAMGGGMVGNLAGLAAALLYRGIRLVHLPTTPVAAFDSTVSLKQGVNLGAGKNLCGTYFVPTLVACDLAWLATVPCRDVPVRRWGGCWRSASKPKCPTCGPTRTSDARRWCSSTDTPPGTPSSSPAAARSATVRRWPGGCSPRPRWPGGTTV